MIGYVRMARDRFKHHLFADDKFCRGHAWDWMVAQARFSAVDVSIAGKTVRLRRGQFSHSIRFMADVWGWDKAAVGRFVARLQTETMIETATDTGQLVVTICNYEKYQADQRPTETATETANDTPARQERDRSETNKNKDKKEEKEVRGGGLSAGACARDNLHENVLAAAGVDPSKDVVGKWYSSGQLWAVQRWRDELGLSDEEIIATVRECANGHPPGTLAYFNPAMQRVAGRKTTPALRPVDNPGQPPPLDLDAIMDRAAAANERRKAKSE